MQEKEKKKMKNKDGDRVKEMLAKTKAQAIRAARFTKKKLSEMNKAKWSGIKKAKVMKARAKAKQAAVVIRYKKKREAFGFSKLTFR